MTYLEAINEVLIRLREETVTTPTDTKYSKLIGVMVNDAKTQVENSYSWNALNQDIVVTTVSGTDTYALVGSGQRFRLVDVVNDTNDTPLYMKDWSAISRLQRTNPLTGVPKYFAFNTVDSNGDTQVTIYPTPDDVYSIVFTSSVPQATLTSASTVIQVPSQPVVLGAYARAVAERGEDQGMASSEIYGLYKDSLSDHIAIESSRTALDNGWDSN